jgi:hypothetical protein
MYFTYHDIAFLFNKSVKVFPIKIKYFMETIPWMSVFSLHFNLGYHSDKKIMLPM